MLESLQTPDKKVSVGAAAIGVPGGVIIAWILSDLVGLTIPAEVASAMGSLISAIAAYFVPN
jgi:putative flippase GtrA